MALYRQPPQPWRYRKRALPTPKALRQFARRWRPHGTTAAWYLWRAADGAKKKK